MKKDDVKEMPKTKALPEEQLEKVSGGDRWSETLDEWERASDKPPRDGDK